jgi:chemotaxis protein histidine kinase CheA
LADALAVTARVSLGHGPNDIEAANPGGCNQYGHGWVDKICPWGGGAGGSPMGTAGSPGGMFTSGPNAGNVSNGIAPDEEKRKKEEAAKTEAEAKRKEAEAKAEAERKAAEEAKAKEEAAKKAAEEKAKREAEEKAKREAAERAKREAEERAKKEAEEKAKREAEERRAAEEKARKEKEQKAAEDDSGLDKKATAKKVEKAVASRAKNPKETSLIPMPVDKTPKMNAPVELGNYAKMPTNGDDESAENLAIREAHALNLTNSQMDTWNNLTVAKRVALVDYTDMSFEYLNRSLYEPKAVIADYGKEEYENWKAQAGRLHDTINNFRTPYNLTVTRGTDSGELDNMGLGSIMPSWGKVNSSAIKSMQKRLAKGEKIEYTNPAFSSTSLDSSNTQYKRPVIIKTFVPKGTHAVYAEPFSAYGTLKNGVNNISPNAMSSVRARSENELILNSGTKHRILSIKEVDNRLEIYTMVVQS